MRPAGRRWKGPEAVLLAGLLGLSLLCGCPSPQRPPNLVVLLVDALRPDRLGCYGYGRPTSPHLDSLAARGILYTRCYAPCDYTPGSVGSLFTGRYPLAHGYVNAGYVLEAQAHTLAEILQERGYRTAGFTANALTGRKYGMDQGFGHFAERNRDPAPQLVGSIVDFVRGHGSAPFFVYAHFMEVHDPQRIPPDRWARFTDPARFVHDLQDTLAHERQVMRVLASVTQQWAPDDSLQRDAETYFREYSELYDAAIAYWDAEAGRLLAALVEAGADGRTLVVVLADHGEQFLEHGFFGHGNSGYQVVLHVPLLVYDPARAARGGLRVDRPMSLIDVLPTLCARLGIDPPEGVQGRSRWPDPEGGQDAPDEGVYSEGTFFANRPFSTLIQTYQQGRWKLVLDRFRDVKELYDLEDDPQERRDRFASEPDTVARLAAALREHHNANLALFVEQTRSPLRQQEEKARELQALGYLAGRHGLARPQAEFHPMRSVPLTACGPFGDEDDLERFTPRLDFAGGSVAWGQVIRGFSDQVGRRDRTGLWFDVRATFLLPVPAGATVVFYEVESVPDARGERPTAVAHEFNGRIYGRALLPGPGVQRVAAPLPAELRQAGHVHAGLRANHRFVLRPGPTPRADIHAALKIRRVWIE
ncbi:MAG: sulfatase [Candidatus Latescibacterota bacterium]